MGFYYGPYSFRYGPSGPFYSTPGYSWASYGAPFWQQPVPMNALTWGGTFTPYTVWSGYGGLGGLRQHGGSYSAQFTATGLPTDEEITEMVYDAIDVDELIPYDADINVTVDTGEVILSGTVIDKSIKHAAGDDAWWVPGVVDVHNELHVTGHHRLRHLEQARQRHSPETTAG